MIKEEVRKKLRSQIESWSIKNPKRVYAVIDKRDVRPVAEILYNDFDLRLSTITALDNEDSIELIYHFGSDATGEIFNIRAYLKDKENLEIDSLLPLFKASDWIEREIHEMFGVVFTGHPNLKHLLLDDDWPQGSCPLRKDFPLKESYPIKEEDASSG